MKIFISWSGETSKLVALALKDWLSKVLQAVKPWMSAVDIDRGVRWRTEMTGVLEETNFGILCMTPDNLESTWIHFEAGALSKKLDNIFVCPYLFQVEPTHLTGPLVQFNAAKANKEDTKKLVLTLNGMLNPPVSSENLDDIFEAFWPQLETRLSEALNFFNDTNSSKEPERTEKEMLTELLELVRDQVRKNANLVSFEEEYTEPHTSDESINTFRPGMRVKHPKYGQGLLLRREGEGKELKFLISFPGFGQKKLPAEFANLKKV